MAIIDMNTGEWLNSDGLLVKFGSDQARKRRAGEYKEGGAGRHVSEVIVDLSLLTADELVLADNVGVPAGAFIEKVEVFVTEEPTEASGTDANIDLGFVKKNATTGAWEELDFNGLLAAADAFHAGTDVGTSHTYVVGTTEVGALVGTVLASTGYFSASAETDAWTDGTIRVHVYWHIPLAADL